MRMGNWPCLVIVALACSLTGSGQESSKLWGKKGELWDREGVLRDFTKVGYMEGAVPIPDWPVGVTVTDFGAKGDGVHDDTKAFRDAIAACPKSHAILVPKGRYRITEQIVLTKDDKSHFVLRGEDMFGSVLFFPEYLSEIYGLPVGRIARAQAPLNSGFFRFEGGTHRSIENLSFEFREQAKGNHWEFVGANAVYMGGTQDSWLRNLYIKNADEAIRLWGTSTKNISVLNVIFDQYIDRGNANRVGHATFMVASSHCLLHNVLLTGKWHHDVMTVQAPKHNVWSRFKGPDIEIDHHSAGSDYGLFTEIYGGLGSTNQYDFLGSNETYWNLKSELELSFWDPKDRNVVVGINTQEASTSGKDFWHENVDPDALVPANLYLAQLDVVGKPRPVAIPLVIPRTRSNVIVLPAVEDGPLMMGANADKNFRGEPLFASVSYQDKKTQKFLLKFDFSGLRLRTVPRATVRLYAGKLKSLRVLSVEDDKWRAETVTFNTAPKGLAEQTVQISAISPGWVDVDVTDFVRRQLKGDQVISLIAESPTKGGGGKFHQAGLMNQPRLVLEAERTAAYPAAPSGLSVTKTASGVRVDWDDSREADVKSYTLYREPIIDKELPVFASGLVDSHFVDKQVRAGAPYTYWVTATDTGTRESAASEKVVFAPAK